MQPLLNNTQEIVCLSSQNNGGISPIPITQCCKMSILFIWAKSHIQTNGKHRLNCNNEFCSTAIHKGQRRFKSLYSTAPQHSSATTKVGNSWLNSDQCAWFSLWKWHNEIHKPSIWYLQEETNLCYSDITIKKVVFNFCRCITSFSLSDVKQHYKNTGVGKSYTTNMFMMQKTLL